MNPLNLRANAVSFDDATVVEVKRRPSTFTLQRQLRALKMRVSFLERALKPAKKTASVDALRQKRDSAERDAVCAALDEYHKQYEIDRYLRDPRLLEIAFRHEQEEADFLRSRGLKPRPSRIPEQFQKGLKAYRPKSGRLKADS